MRNSWIRVWLDQFFRKESSPPSSKWLVDIIFTERLLRISLTLTSESHNDCNAPILRVRRCYCDVYTQDGNTLIYTLSIITSKNQSTKIYGALYIPTYEYNYKIITRCDIILQEYYIIDRHKCENTKRCTSMNSTNGAHEFTEGKLERRAESLEG